MNRPSNVPPPSIQKAARTAARRPAWLAMIDSDVLLRALAIMNVVWNHANPQALGEYGGGMTTLMMLSGFNFARFSLRGSTPADTRRALVSLSVRIGLPSLLMVLFFFAVLRSGDWKELLFVSNWWTIDRISIFPTWYPQVMLQMFLILYVLMLTPLARSALAHPLPASLLLFGAGVAMRILMPIYVWDTDYLHHNLPYLYLWNFTLGWVVYFLVVDRPSTWSTICLAIGCVILGSYAGWGWQRLDFWWLTAAGTAFVLIRKVSVPKPVAAACGLVSQAAFAIFLLHRFSFVVLNHIVPAWKQREPMFHFLFALTISVAAWVLLTAVGRAYRIVRGGVAA